MRGMIERISLVCVIAGAPLLVAAQSTSTDSPATTAATAQTEQAAPLESDAEGATAEAEGAPATTEGEDATATAETEGAPATAEGEDATATAETEGAPATAEGEDATATAEAEAAPAPVEGQIILQSEDSILAQDLLGQTVYSNTEDSVGDINNIIIKLDGSVEGVVVGVGGFLGMGEKEVAIELEKIEFVSQDGGGTQLILNASREDLEAAPAFKTAREQQREAEAEEMKQNMDQGVAPAAPETN